MSFQNFEKLSETIAVSFEKLLDYPLMEGACSASDLYKADAIILAHDGSADPRFTYANEAAQKLWELSLDEFIGMPSRYSAEPDKRDERQRMLQEAESKGYFCDYKGIRISKSGCRFYIENAIIWNLLDENGKKCGQAATFSNWTYLNS